MFLSLSLDFHIFNILKQRGLRIALPVRLFIHLFNSLVQSRILSTTTGQIPMEFGADIHGLHWILMFLVILWPSVSSATVPFIRFVTLNAAVKCFIYIQFPNWPEIVHTVFLLHFFPAIEVDHPNSPKMCFLSFFYLWPVSSTAVERRGDLLVVFYFLNNLTDIMWRKLFSIVKCIRGYVNVVIQRSSEVQNATSPFFKWLKYITSAASKKQQWANQPHLLDISTHVLETW